MKLTMLGTGNALVTEYYNTCFIIEDNNSLFMVDGGGGNTILRQIKHAAVMNHSTLPSSIMERMRNG